MRSWAGLRTTAIARELDCHPQTVRERLTRFNAEGVDGLGDRPGPGRPPRLTEHERSQIVALARSHPPGAIIRQPDGTLETAATDANAQWSLDALAAAARGRGIPIGRSQVRRILPARKECAGAASTPGPRAPTRTSPQKDRHRRALHRAA